MFRRLTGQVSPDIILAASCMWCAANDRLSTMSTISVLSPRARPRSVLIRSLQDIVQHPPFVICPARNVMGFLSGTLQMGFALSCRDLAFWTGNETFFSKDVDGPAQPHLGEDRLHTYIADLTDYVNMLRASFPGVRFLGLHTMPQRNPRQAFDTRI